MNSMNQELIRFIERSPSPFHAVQEVSSLLKENGFVRLYEGKKWNLERGTGYYVVRNDSSLIAFVIGPGGDTFRIAASHTDFPTFRIKQKPELPGPDSYLRINVEAYGGITDSSWLDRPLGIAGRVLVRDGSAIESRLIAPDADLLMIPSLCYHFNPDVNSGYAFKVSKDMLPLFSAGSLKSGGFTGMIAEMVSAEESDILGWDLSLVNRAKGVVWGRANEFLSAPRLDDLQCVFASLKGFLASEPSNGIQVFCCFDNEEVGSRSSQGALSDFLKNTLLRIQAGIGNPEPELGRVEANSFFISADNAHALQPNHPDKTDEKNFCMLNRGIVIKDNPRKYMTTAASRAVVAELCARAGVPVQTYHNHSDIPGGGTLGNMSASHVSICGADVGLAHLAMHSSYETVGALDTGYAASLYLKFYETEITFEEETGRILLG